MTKNEALKMAHKSFMQLNERHPRKDNGNGYFDEEIQACKEALEQEERTQRTMHCGTADAFIAMDDDHKRRWFVQSLRESKRRKELEDILEQPLTRDWKETIDERIAKDDKFKEALEQPSVAELNDEYLLDTHVEGLSQPSQEPVAWINVKDKLPPQESNFLSFSETFGYQVSMYSSNPLNSTGLPTLERLKITKWMPIPHITLSAPSWQGLSDDEIDEQIEKASIPQYQGMDVTATNLRQFAKNILNIVKVKNND